MFGMTMALFAYNDTWSGDFKAPTDDELERLERKFRSAVRGKRLLGARPTLLGTRAGDAADEAAVARGEAVDLPMAADLLLQAGAGTTDAGATGAATGSSAGSSGKIETPSRISSALDLRPGSQGSSTGSGVASPAPVSPAVSLGRRGSKEPSIRSQVKEVLALVRLTDRAFLEELLRLQERHTTSLACLGFVPIRRWSRRAVEREAEQVLDDGLAVTRNGDEQGQVSGSDSDSESETSSDGDDDEGDGDEEEDGGDSVSGFARPVPAAGRRRRGPGPCGLLQRCEPVRDGVHERLRLLPTLSCSKWMPYCMGCGIKVGLRGSLPGEAGAEGGSGGMGGSGG